MATEPEEDDVKFIDAEQWQGGKQEGMSFRQLVMLQMQKISVNSNVEFRGGYWQQKIIPMQGGVTKMTEEYLPDTREIYSNSIEFLHDLCLPHFDVDMDKASKAYNDSINKCLSKYTKDGQFTEDEKLMFRENKRELCRILWQGLSKFLKRMDYFNAKSYEEEI